MNRLIEGEDDDPQQALGVDFPSRSQELGLVLWLGECDYVCLAGTVLISYVYICAYTSRLPITYTMAHIMPGLGTIRIPQAESCACKLAAISRQQGSRENVERSVL